MDPQILAALNQAALAALVVLLVTGLLIPKPAHEFVVKLLGLAHEREGKLVEELDKHSGTIVTLSGRLEKLSEQVLRLEEALKERPAR